MDYMDFCSFHGTRSISANGSRIRSVYWIDGSSLTVRYACHFWGKGRSRKGNEAGYVDAANVRLEEASTDPTVSGMIILTGDGADNEPSAHPPSRGAASHSASARWDSPK
uniref:Uncharacterized protein n=1 Tax=Aegilops tauschii subsp. strangulata TaxID=200361 RepID=A0A453CA13_AEGTS